MTRAKAKGRMDSWEKILEYLEQHISPQSYTTWFQPARFSHEDEGVLYVRVPNETFRTWYEGNCTQLMQEALERLALGVERIEWLCPAPAPSPAAPRTPPSQVAFDFDAPVAQLNPRYTFDAFVVGQSNQFAHAAADRVAREPSKAYNPLFLYGGVGMGKTHLLHAIGHALLAQRKLRLCYVTTNRFLHEVINSIRYDRMTSFHDRYRNLDVLLVDDIHFVSSKERTQEEFFHTFNALYESQKQIVFTSDRPPKEIPQLEDRLRSRFEWGLMADIQPPDLETKMAILDRKAEESGAELPDEVRIHIATHMKSNIRQLEGALIRLIAISSVSGSEITLSMAKQALRSIAATGQQKVTIEAIQKRVAEEFDLKPSQLREKSNTRAIAYPRQIAMYLCKELTGSSLPEIGRSFGGKHHTTVLHAVNKIERERQDSLEMNRFIHKLTDTFN